jgi:5S rRNA maturation endonuclease (ribonuclease M5)
MNNIIEKDVKSNNTLSPEQFSNIIMGIDTGINYFGCTGINHGDVSIDITPHKVTTNEDITISEDIDVSTIKRVERSQLTGSTNKESTNVLSHFKMVRYRKDNQWMACCPAHKDVKPSLSITYTEDKKWLFHCFSGCGYHEIIKAADLSQEDLGRKPSKNGSMIEAVYTYTDEDGNYLFESQRVRMKDGSKEFFQKTKDSKSTKGVRKVLYNLPRVIECCSKNKPLIIVEGEKDVETISKFTSNVWYATTNPGGAGKWLEEYTRLLKSNSLTIAFIFADNDEPGRRHAKNIAKSLAVQDIKSRIINFPDLKDHGDFSDWLDSMLETTQDDALITKKINDIILNSPFFELNETDKRYSLLRAKASKMSDWTTDSVITDYISSCYYNASNGHYLMKKGDDYWVDMIHQRASIELGLRGVPVIKNAEREDEQLPDVELALHVIRQDNTVEFSGDIAGYNAGFHKNCGKNVLVTSSPQYPIPSVGNHDIISKLLLNMLGEEQKLILECMLKLHIEQLYDCIEHQQQIICLVGDAGSGKSLLQNLIITPLLGGRSARVYKFLSGQDQFNSQIIGNEHLIIEDDSPAFDPRSRNTLTVNLTGIASNSVTSVRAMHQAAINLSAIQLVTLSANPDNVNTLPFINDSSSGKIALFNCKKVDLPFDVKSVDGRKKLREKINEEIPCYLHYLINQLKVPGEFADPRYPVFTYQNPEILALLETQSPEGELLDMLQDFYFSDNEKSVKKSTSEIMIDLSMDNRFQHRSEKLLSNSRVAGRLLNNLSKKYQNNFKFNHTMRGATWTITPINGNDNKRDDSGSIENIVLF